MQLVSFPSQDHRVIDSTSTFQVASSTTFELQGAWLVRQINKKRVYHFSSKGTWLHGVVKKGGFTINNKVSLIYTREREYSFMLASIPVKSRNTCLTNVVEVHLLKGKEVCVYYVWGR